jgi:hypothetical protein
MQIYLLFGIVLLRQHTIFTHFGILFSTKIRYPCATLALPLRYPWAIFWQSLYLFEDFYAVQHINVIFT